MIRLHIVSFLGKFINIGYIKGIDFACIIATLKDKYKMKDFTIKNSKWGVGLIISTKPDNKKYFLSRKALAKEEWEIKDEG